MPGRFPLNILKSTRDGEILTETFFGPLSLYKKRSHIAHIALGFQEIYQKVILKLKVERQAHHLLLKNSQSPIPENFDTSSMKLMTIVL